MTRGVRQIFAEIVLTAKLRPDTTRSDDKLVKLLFNQSNKVL